jgi:hypothetical protein
MGSGTRGYYDDATLLALEEAFKGSWAVVSAHELLDAEKEIELRTKLADKLMTLVAEGVTHPDELQRLALESFSLRSSSVATKGRDAGSM